MHPTGCGAAWAGGGFGAAWAGGFSTKGLKANRFKEKNNLQCVWTSMCLAVKRRHLCAPPFALPVFQGGASSDCCLKLRMWLWENMLTFLSTGLLAKKDKALSIRHIGIVPRHRWSFHRWPQGSMNATTHGIGLLWLDAIASNLKCTLDQ